ncbi:MAG TPA: RNA 3'-terminal phosphate cyclase [Pyrinomonadaceae bacterium]|nr:RNA 3'-terminal phosphate cyclase [Pyrinomonadaceae bacterium]
MIQIDGSLGEGGGQILRSALTLALVTNQATEVKNIRSRRPQPGLMPQHLKAVEAAAAVGGARVEGAHLQSRSLLFEPTTICSGDFEFDVGTAGNTPLVLQTIFLPLSFAQTASSVTLIGGTHVPWSPCFHYLDLHWLPYMRQIGFAAELKLELAGFYPHGGGRMRADIRPATKLTPLNVRERGALKSIRGISAIANLDWSVAERQERQALKRLKDLSQDIEIEMIQMPSLFRSTMLLLIVTFEGSKCCFFGLGELGKRAERVADEAVDQLLQFLANEGAIDHHLADQLILPLALVPGVSELKPDKITKHLITNAEVIRMFLAADIDVRGELGHSGSVRINGTSISKCRSQSTN